MDALVAAIVRAGGAVSQRLDTLGAVAATVPIEHLEELASAADVTSLAPNAQIGAASVESRADISVSTASAGHTIGADQLWSRGIDGSGVDVALIDSGVAPVARVASNVVNGPDFSSERSIPNLASLDGFGHGTHLASIITGTDTATGDHGVAPGSRVVNVKVADHNGTTDVFSIMSGIQWVVDNQHKHGYNIRVINLAFGAGLSDVNDPLSQAVEIAWKSGIVVVVSAGNAGNGSNGLDSPAMNPYVIAVGATDTSGLDPTVPAFSNSGDGVRNPDVVAPGHGIVGARVPNGALDTAFPGSRIGANGFRGSGTSQAAAVISGAAALMLDANPKLTPDDVKLYLQLSATPLPGIDPKLQGRGQAALEHLDVSVAKNKLGQQKYGTGNKGDPFKNYLKMMKKLASGKGAQSEETLAYDPSMTGNRWSGNRWSGNRWSGNRWSGVDWDT